MNDVSWTRRIGATLVALGMGGAVVASSNVPWSTSEGGAELRLSWTGTAPTTEACRPPTEVELAGLPQHMRPSEICEGDPVRFHLRVVVDGEVFRSGPLDEGGRGESAISVFHTIRLEPGPHTVELEFSPGEAVSEDLGDLSYRLNESLNFEPGRAMVVEWDRTGGFAIQTENPRGGASS